MLSRKLPLALVALCVLAVAAAHAQSPLGIGTAEPGIPATGLFRPLFTVVNQYQQDFYRALTGALKGMRDNPSELWTLIGLSFAYGIFHAAGPGHGKAVISSYMVANEVELKRGIFISLVSALLQGLTAILVVGLAFVVLRRTSISMTDATTALERLSFVMVVLFGAWLLFRKIRQLVPRPASETTALFGGSPGVDASGAVHLHGPDCRHGFGTFAATDAAASATGVSARGSSAYVCDSCGHTHLPEPGQLGGGRFGLREAWSAIIAVGLRPCSGALLVLTFSLLNGLYLGGILSVLAMSIGTAITVSALATLAVTAKGLALRLAGPGSRRGLWVGHAVEIGGAVFVIAMGGLLLGASLQS